jgi:DNA polymerase-3 subunit gamma/tau
MVYQVLARKWRPRQFEEVVGQTHVTRTLQNAIKQNKLAHAYLFTGTRGVGKTSIARLFAKAIRCEHRKPDFNPCLTCAACRDIDTGSSMDYLEIDGASNNSVDDVRALIENVQYLPTRGRYKIYVIDEVHMLSVSAFNALLKTLEEPPAHVIFILATTDPHKLLGTVISRCQRYDFKNVPTDVLMGHLLKIAEVEQIKFATPLIPRRLAELGKGSVRDSLSIFDQVLGLSEGDLITEESLTSALGIAGTGAMKELLSSMLVGEIKTCSHIYSTLIDENIDLKKLCDQILDGVYNIIRALDNQAKLYSEGVIKEGALSGMSVAELFWIYETLVKDFGWALTSLNPEKVVLIVLQKLTLRRSVLKGDDIKVEAVVQPGKPEAGEVRAEKQAQLVVPKKAKTWNDFLSFLRQTSPATASNLAHGNLLGEMNAEARPLVINVAFPDEAAVFGEFINGRDVYSRLKANLADFFELGLDEIDFKTQLLSDTEKRDKNFKTKVEIDDELNFKKEEERKQKILNDPFVKEAERLFNSKVDKIILKDQER